MLCQLTHVRSTVANPVQQFHFMAWRAVTQATAVHLNVKQKYNGHGNVAGLGSWTCMTGCMPSYNATFKYKYWNCTSRLCGHLFESPYGLSLIHLMAWRAVTQATAANPIVKQKNNNVESHITTSTTTTMTATPTAILYLC